MCLAPVFLTRPIMEVLHISRNRPSNRRDAANEATTGHIRDKKKYSYNYMETDLNYNGAALMPPSSRFAF